MELTENMTLESNYDLNLNSNHLVHQSNERSFGKDIRRLVKLVCKAFLNPSELAFASDSILAYVAVYIPWDVEEYYLEHVKEKKDRNRVKYPNPHFGSFSSPLTVVDSKGRIVLWYLPGLLSEQHQVCILFFIHLKLAITIQDSWMLAVRLLALGLCLMSR